MSKIPELLSPAGSYEALTAAIEGGADAVYLGAGKFNARMRAENFDGVKMSEALSLCASYGVKSYVTLNTRLFDDELSDALHLSADLYENGVSALIVADMGIAGLIKQHIPDLELHASTQLSGHSTSDAKALFDAGFSRMVCQREITAEELKKLCHDSPLEIEMFIHGAHCVSFSGQCLMSAMLGGRSGNRGECAQPCRQPYYVNGKKSYPLSLKDMCLAGHITDIISSGAASLKIEGRQKSPEYVLGTAKIYRRLLDEKRNADESETEELRELFSRGGFTDGYYTNNRRNMLGVRTLDDYLSSDNEKFSGLTKKIPLDAVLTVNESSLPCLSFSAGNKTVTVTGETADIMPLTREGAMKNVSRLGNTPFVLRNFDFISDGKASLTLSALNAMRREAVKKLTDAGRNPVSLPDNPVSAKGSKPKGEIIYTAEFLKPETVTEKSKEFFTKIYLPYGMKNTKFGQSLPPYLPDTAWDKVWETCSDSILVHSAAELIEAKKHGKCAALSLRGNVFNSRSAEYYGNLTGDFITVAPEVKLPKIRDISCPSPLCAVVYGRLPLMTCVRCAISDGKEKCRGKGKDSPLCFSEFSDRYRIGFPTVGLPDCTNVIYNSVPIYMADRQDDIKRAGVTVFHFIFTDETPEEVDRIIYAYKNNTPSEKKNIRRML